MTHPVQYKLSEDFQIRCNVSLTLNQLHTHIFIATVIKGMLNKL